MGLFSSIAKVAGGLIGGPIGAVLGGLGGISENKSSAKANQAAIDAAAAAQTAGLNRALDFQEKAYGEASTNLHPAITAGNDALGGIRGLLGLDGPGSQQNSIDTLRGSPLYQSLFGNGRDAILAAGSATGGLRGGNINDALFKNGRDTLSQVIQQQLANLGGLSSQGVGAAGSLGAFGAKAAGTEGEIATDIGRVGSSSILQKQGIGNAATSANNNTLGQIGSLLGGGSGGIDLGAILKNVFSGGGITF